MWLARRIPVHKLNIFQPKHNLLCFSNIFLCEQFLNAIMQLGPFLNYVRRWGLSKCLLFKLREIEVEVGIYQQNLVCVLYGWPHSYTLAKVHFLRRELKNHSCTKFPENLPMQLLSNSMGKFSGNSVQL